MPRARNPRRASRERRGTRRGRCAVRGRARGRGSANGDCWRGCPTCALLTDADRVGEGDRVLLLTVHNARVSNFARSPCRARGGLMPHASSLDSGVQLEEERRLSTWRSRAARDEVLLTAAAYRRRSTARAARRSRASLARSRRLCWSARRRGDRGPIAAAPRARALSRAVRELPRSSGSGAPLEHDRATRGMPKP